MIRVIAGTAGGRRLAVPPGSRTRPTSDRAREGLFNSLGPVDGTRVLDLFSGSGAIGLEALSRGASAATMVEADTRAAATVRANARALGLPGATVVQARAERWLAAQGQEGEYDVVFLDPPYALPADDLGGLLDLVVPLVRHGEPGLVVVERATRDGAPPWPMGLREVRSRRYGEGTLWYGCRA